MLYYMRFSDPLNHECEAQSCSIGGGSSHGVPTPALFRHMTTGTQFRSVSIEQRRDAHSGARTIYDRGDVGICSVRLSGTTDEDNLKFKRVKVSYL